MIEMLVGDADDVRGERFGKLVGVESHDFTSVQSKAIMPEPMDVSDYVVMGHGILLWTVWVFRPAGPSLQDNHRGLPLQCTNIMSVGAGPRACPNRNEP